MRRKKLKRKLSSYLNGELKERENKIISEHLEKCPDCKKDFIALSQHMQAWLFSRKPSRNRIALAE